MADTYLNLVNKVLIRLREDQVSNVSDTTYSTLIGEFVNQAKQELENMWDWSVLRSNVSITLGTDGTTTDVALTGTNKRTRITAVYNDTQDYRLSQADREWINDKATRLDDISGEPRYYSTAGIDASEQLQLKLYPASETADTLLVSCVIPEAELSSNTDTTDLPALPIILRAYSMAISERGEDGGVGFEESDKAASIALGDALLQDQQWFQNEVTWFPS